MKKRTKRKKGTKKKNKTKKVNKNEQPKTTTGKIEPLALFTPAHCLFTQDRQDQHT